MKRFFETVAHKRNTFAYLVFISAFIATFFRGVKSFFMPPSMTTYLWNEELVQPVLSFYDLSYQEFLSLGIVEFLINWAGVYFGVVLVCSALLLLPFLIKTLPKETRNSKEDRMFSTLAKTGSIVGCLHVFAIAFTYYSGKGHMLAQIIEWGIQAGSPLVVFIWLQRHDFRVCVRFVEYIVALTFLGHGLFAAGIYYDVPGHFIDMTITFFGASESFARTFLLIAGVLDILICAVLVLKIRARPVLAWAVIWGGATALTRVLTGLDMTSLPSVLYWTNETVLRLPHMLVPAMLLLWDYYGAQSSALSSDQDSLADKRIKAATQ